MRAINILELTIGYTILKHINGMLPSMSNSGVLFIILLACASIHQSLDYVIYPACTVITGSKEWSLKLLQMVPGVFWVQGNQQVRLGVSSLHAMVFHILK